MRANGSVNFILVVDDLEEWRKLATLLLESGGYETRSVSNGQEALTYLHEHPDVTAAIVLDLNMPVMGGWEFMRRQQENGFKGIPVILFSGEAKPPVSKLEGTSVVAFVSKDHTIDALVPAVERAVEKSRISA